MCLFLLRNANIIYNLTKKIELNTFSLELVFCGGFNLKRVKQKEETRSVSEDGVLYFRTLPKSPKYDKRCIISRHTRKVERWFPVPVFKDQNSKGIENSGSVMLAQFAKYLEFWGRERGSLDWLGWSKYTNYHFNSAKFVFTLDSRPGMTKAWWDVFNGPWWLACVRFYPLVMLCRLQASAAGSVWTLSWCHCGDCSILQWASSHDLSQNVAEKHKLQPGLGSRGPAGDINMTLKWLWKISVSKFLFCSIFPVNVRVM